MCPWNRTRRTTKVKVKKQTNGGEAANSQAVPITDQPRRDGNNKAGRSPQGGGYVTRITNDDRENEMDDNLE